MHMALGANELPGTLDENKHAQKWLIVRLLMCTLRDRVRFAYYL